MPPGREAKRQMGRAECGAGIQCGCAARVFSAGVRCGCAVRVLSAGVGVTARANLAVGLRDDYGHARVGRGCDLGDEGQREGGLNAPHLLEARRVRAAEELLVRLGGHEVRGAGVRGGGGGGVVRAEEVQ